MKCNGTTASCWTPIGGRYCVNCGDDLSTDARFENQVCRWCRLAIGTVEHCPFCGVATLVIVNAG